MHGLTWRLSGLGIILSAALAGIALARGQDLWAVLAAGGCFALALALPFIFEYIALRAGYDDLRAEHNDRVHPPDVDVFTPADDDRTGRSWRSDQFPGRLTLALCGAGYGLLSYHFFLSP